ncbi:hypothetical protein AGMMS49991_12060 [Spirochaetia bacterium]|nr:hypothetical protein AGMMS49991_12060 [Spirochaetia bacterium]
MLFAQKSTGAPSSMAVQDRKTFRLLKRIVKCFIPYGFIAIRRRIKARKLDKTIIIPNYFLNLDYSKQDNEIRQIIDYFKNNTFSGFPYAFTKKYRSHNIEVQYDESCNMYFAIHKGKKLYCPEEWSYGKTYDYYNDLCLEQDDDSPHHYETNEFTVQDGDVIADIGAAEGIWALTYVEKAEKIYLFECENTKLFINNTSYIL